MMKKLALLVGFLIVFGGSAVATHAQTPVDPTIALHYPDPPACPTGAYCVNLSFDNTTGSPAFINELFATVPSSGLPDTVLSPGFPPAVTYSCQGSGGLFLFYPVTDPGFPTFPYSQTSASFLGCDFLGLVPSGVSTYTISSSGGYVTLDLGSGFCPDGETSCPAGTEVTLAPEPNTFLLFMSGLVLFCMGGFARKRFGVSHA